MAEYFYAYYCASALSLSVRESAQTGMMASCRHSLKPRLSIPVGLTLAFVAYNHIVDKSLRLGYVEVSCLVAGFLASKVIAWTAADAHA